jgi:hypothetical protein
VKLTKPQREALARLSDKWQTAQAVGATFTTLRNLSHMGLAEWRFSERQLTGRVGRREADASEWRKREPQQ